MLSQSEHDAIFARAESMPLTLDGKPARLIGRRCEFPGVYVIADAEKSAIAPAIPFSWRTVCNVLAKGGAFRS